MTPGLNAEKRCPTWYGQFGNSFMERREINPILAGITVLAITLIIGSWHSWQVARKNPVEALRNE